MGTMRLLLIALLIACLPAAAHAGCASRPDSAASSYIENQQALALCQAAELADDVRALRQQVDLDTQLRALGNQIRLDQQAVQGRLALPHL